MLCYTCYKTQDSNALQVWQFVGSVPSDGSGRPDCPQSWPWPLTMILYSPWAPAGATPSLKVPTSLWPLSSLPGDLNACLYHWSLSEAGVAAGHWWSLVSSNWSHSVLQSGSAHSELVTVSSLLSLGPGRLGTGRGATDTAHPPPSTGGGRTFPPGHKPALATWAKWAKMLGGHGSLIWNKTRWEGARRVGL